MKKTIFLFSLMLIAMASLKAQLKVNVLEIDSTGKENIFILTQKSTTPLLAISVNRTDSGDVVVLHITAEEAVKQLVQQLTKRPVKRIIYEYKKPD